mmetsp:Transcript_38023/g.100583  ORF Transcript_38023/g.100583 Transcript_38023/m.100583 type:complete len:247 (-) Transcript_38023:36-776(-)
MGGSASKREECVLELSGGQKVTVRYRKGAGLGFTPWPATFALAAFLDAQQQRLDLRSKSVLELGSGACTVSGLVAGHLCKKVTLTDRVEVIHDIGASVQAAGLSEGVCEGVSVKVLNWMDLEFTESCFQPGEADVILMSDVVYFPTLFEPLVHTLLLLCTEQTRVLWANCDRYPHLVPDLDRFLSMVGRFFDVQVEEDAGQVCSWGPSIVPNGRVVIRSLRLADAERAREVVEMVMKPTCVRKCFG